MPKKTLVVDPDKCIGCNTCPLVAPEYFELNTTDYKAVVKKQPTDFDDPNVTQSVTSCPVGAISIITE